MLSRWFRLAVLPSRSQARVVEVSQAISTLMASSGNGSPANAKDCRTNSLSPLLLYGGCSNFNIQKQQALAFSTNTRRRRRRGGGGGGATSQNPMDEDTSDDKPSASSHGNLSNTQFLSIANSLLDKVESAVTKLKDSNDGLEVTRYSPSTGPSHQYNSDDGDEEEDHDPRNQAHGGQLSIQVQSSGDFFWGGGTYWLTIHSDSRTATLQSPLSGTFTYRYNASSDEWIGTDDGHSLLGMLTRDWIRQCRGVPDF